MEVSSKFLTNFSPRNYSPKEFIDIVAKSVPKREIFVIPITNKLGYLTMPFSAKKTDDRWCLSDNGTKILYIDKTLIFQPTYSSEYMYTKDGKSYKCLDENKIMEILKKRPDLSKKNRFHSNSEPCVGSSLDSITR